MTFFRFTIKLKRLLSIINKLFRKIRSPFSKIKRLLSKIKRHFLEHTS